MRFFALSYHVPSTPSRYRVAVWKACKELGAVYLQDGMAALPESAAAREAFRALQAQIQGYGGHAALLEVSFCDAQEESALLESFREARKEEYCQLRDDARRLCAQYDWARKNTPDTFDEESYALELRRLRRRMEAVIQRDYFAADGQEEAQREVEEAVHRLPAAQQMPTRAKRTGKPSRPAAENVKTPTASGTAATKTSSISRKSSIKRGTAGASAMSEAMPISEAAVTVPQSPSFTQEPVVPAADPTVSNTVSDKLPDVPDEKPAAPKEEKKDMPWFLF